MVNKRNTILSDATHPLYKEFDSLRIDRSGRFRVPFTCTQRFKQSFVPRAILDYNHKLSRADF